MRKGWRKLKLGEFCEIRQGKNLAISQLSSGEFPVFGANGIVGFYDDFNFSSEVVALGCRGSCGTVHLVNESAWLANNVMAVWPKNKNLAVCKFVALLLETADLKSSGVISGQVQPQITRTSLSPLSCLLPPLTEQKRIVDVVSSVDAYIDALQQQAITARTAFLAICEEIVLTGENMKPLHEVASVIMGQSPEGSTCNTDGIGTPLLTGPTEFTKRIVGPPRQWTSKETKLSQSGDILFCVRGATAGRINIGNYKSVIGRGLAAIRCGNSEDTNFVRFALLVGLGQLLPAAGGTIFPNISQSQLRNFEVSWPSENRRAELSGLVRSIEEVVLRTEHAIDDAKKLRSGLLFDLLSGEHEIPTSYDKFLGAA
jgi:type I restriction enzyme S subunit